jgi:hypothetical protein
MGHPLRYGFSSYLRLWGGRLGLFWLDKFSWNLRPKSKTRAQHAVGDAIRKKVGPLIDCLVCDAHRTSGSSDGAAEKFYCLCFAHAILNHSSGITATIVNDVSDNISNYG